MRPALVMSLLIAFSVPSLVLPADDPLGDNAALQYWQAFASMPYEQDWLKPEQKKILEEWQTAPLDKMAVELIELPRSERALRSLHRGAAVQRCSWGVTKELQENGPLSFPDDHSMHGFRLARLALLRARYLFQKSEPNAALDDVIDVLKMARHIGTDGTSHVKVFELGIEDRANQITAANLGTIKEPALLKNTLARLESVAKPDRMSDALRREKEWYLAWLRTKRVAALDVVIIIHEGPEAKQRMEAIHQLLGIDDAVVEKVCDAFAKRFDEVIAAAELPYDKYDAASKSLEEKLKGFDPTSKPLIVDMVPKLLLGGNVKVRRAEMKIEARRAMLRAAIAIAANGEGELKSTKDPFSDGPFEYTKLPDGFELKSKLRDHEGKPVTLRVGQ
jgi:hypothetical protein